MGDRLKYFDPQKVGAFSGANSFKRVSKNPEAWLKSQDTYTLHVPVRKKFPRQKNNCPRPSFSNAGRFD